MNAFISAVFTVGLCAGLTFALPPVAKAATTDCPRDTTALVELTKKAAKEADSHLRDQALICVAAALANLTTEFEEVRTSGMHAEIVSDIPAPKGSNAE